MYNSIWIRGLRTINKALFGIILIGGVFGAIAAGVAIGGFIGFLSFIGISCAALFFSFISVALIMVFLDLAEDISCIAGNTQHDGQFEDSQGSSIFDVFAEEKKKEHEQDMLKNGGWKCSVCGKVNANYTGTCSCGNSKYKNETV